MNQPTDENPKREMIGISPGVGILAIFRYIKYKSWFALAEYVDNAIDSYLKNSRDLDDSYPGYQLLIDIELNFEENYIRISDNAAGINGVDLERALRMAVRPHDRSGLSEFGMGMKAASCWFSPKWSVETQALGDNVKRKVVFDVQRIVESETNELSTNPTLSIIGPHFTNIHLGDVYSMPTQHAVAKIREHLTSIYRSFLRDDKIAITVNGRLLKYKSPSVLVAVPVGEKNAVAVEWRKDLDFTCAGGQRITGYAAVYATAKTKEAGFALLRRNRVVEGSFDEPYRPAKVFGAPGSFYSQRIYGELNVDDFAASFTKDGIQWEDAEADFLSRLKAALKSPGLDLLKQANDMRMKKTVNSPVDPTINANANGNVGRSLESGHVPSVDDKQVKNVDNTDTQDNLSPTGRLDDIRNGFDTTDLVLNNTDLGSKLSSANTDTIKEGETHKSAQHRTLAATVDDVHWNIYIELSHNPAHTDWMTINRAYVPEGIPISTSQRSIGIRVSQVHAFTTKYCSSDPNQIEPLLRFCAAFAIAKTIAQEGGVPHSSVLVDYVNELLLKF